MSTNYIALGLTSAGTSQATALVIDQGIDYLEFSTVGAGTGCILPITTLIVSGTSDTGYVYNTVTKKIALKNDGANALAIYPAVGSTINNLAQNSAFLLPGNGGEVSFIASSDVQWYSFSQKKTPLFIPVSVTATLTTNQSGATFLIDQSVGVQAYTLPAVTNKGVSYNFIISTSGANAITITSPTAVMNGTLAIMIAAGAVGVLASNATNVIFAASNLVGSHLAVVSDGTHWLVDGSSKIVSGFTVS